MHFIFAVTIDRLTLACRTNAICPAQVDGRLFVVDVVDSVEDYVLLMKQLFDFDELRTLLTGSDGNQPLRILIDCLNGGQ